MVSKGTRPGSRPIKSPKPTPPRTKRPKLSQEIKTKTTAKSSSSSEDESEDATGIGLEEVTTTSGCSSSAPGDLILNINGHPESDLSDSHSGSTRPDLFVRHRAQRKFAQGVSLALFSVHQIQPTPPPTPLKLKPKERATPTKKVPLPHFSPPVKRPKTEDFINFLCYRGTPALPKSLKFFNYPSPFEHLQQKSAKSGALNLKTMASKNLLADKESISSRSRAGSICSEKLNNLPKFKSSATSSNNKKKPSSFVSPQGLPLSSNSVVPLGSLSPTKPTHINEQEAKFALSALKLKYQKKLSKDKRGPVSISKLVKKAKVRSAILTRSKSKDNSEDEKDEEIGNKGPTSTPKVAKKSSSSTVVVKESESASRELKRTLAPSPDIIDGVGSRGSKIQHGSSTSSSDSDRAEHSSDSSGESSTESSSSEPEEGETENVRKATIRTLRSGNKSIHSLPKAMSNSPIPIPKDKTNFTKTDMERNKKKIPKKLENNRVSTRSAHRTTASPLRELPMYNEVKKKNKKLKKKKPTQQSKPKLSLPESEKHLKSNEKSGAGSISSRRPSRRTKENAALFLGFITHAFSSDENDHDVGKGNGSDGGNSSAPDSCDTSSSETKFLESKYKAIMKRDQDKLIPKNKSHSSSSNPTSRANFLKKLRLGVNSNSSKNSIIKAKQTLLSKTKSKTKPEKRLLRSQSIKEELPNSLVNSGVCRVTRRRSTVPLSPRDKQQTTKILGNRHAGAVRKTTKIVPRKNNCSKTSDTEPQTHSEDSESSSSSDDEEMENSSASESSAPRVPETKPQVSGSSSSSSDEEDGEADEPRMGVEKVPRTVSPDLCAPISRSEYPAVEESSDQSELEEGGDNGSGSDSDSVIIERVEIAIQVDMDLEEGIIEQQSPPPPILSPQITTPYLPQPPRTGTIGVGPGLGLGMSIPLSVQQQHLPPQNPSLIRHPIITTGFNGHNFFTPHHHAFHHHTSSTVEFISQHRMTHTTHQTQDFSGGGLMIPGEGGTTLLPVPSGPFHNYGSHVPHSQPISMSIPLQCFSTAQHTATTLETHIRSVAANLDIPLVRPIVTSNSSFHPHHQLPISMGMSIPMPLVRPNVLNTSNSTRQPLTRPIVSLWNNPHSHQQQSTSHFSAFRSPNEPHYTQSHQHYSRPLNPTVSVSAYPGLSAHGLSLIQSLPNVSIVPKFDRNSKPLVNIPPPESFLTTQTSSNSTPTPTKTKPPKKQKELKIPKERGRKRKIPIPFPPSSPLTVRKDSVNPATYAGTSSKKNIPKSSCSGTSTEIERSAQETVVFLLTPSNSAPEHTTEDSFTKLLQASKSKTPSPMASETAGPRSGGFQSKTSELKSKKGESTSKSAESKLANNLNQPKIDSKSKNHVSSPLNPESPSTTNIKVTKKDLSLTNSRPSSVSSKDSQASSCAATSSSDKFSKPPKLKKSKSIENMNIRKKSDNRATPETISKAKKPEPEYQKSKVESPNPNSPVPILKSHHHKSEQPQRPSSTHSHNSNPSEESEHVPPLRIHSIPTYHPSEQEFQDPFKFIAQIQKEAEQFGMARIIPPKNFRPECNVEDDMRFTAYNHYIHRMYSRWGPNVQERLAMLENLRKSKVEVSVSTPPQIGGMEIDLSTLYHTVQNFGGLTEVIQKDRWNKVSDAMHIPKAANDRASKLDAIYVKYVLPYEMLSDVERKRLHAEVNEKWKERLKKDADESESESEDENPYEQVEDCIVKGKSTPLSSFFRIGRNTLSMLFQSKEPSWSEVESRYWKLVKERDRHLCVYSGSIDCTGSTHRSAPGFPTTRAQTGSKHPWNLKVFANSSGSVLRSLGPVLGATVPTLQIGMIFTTYCWYSDPHGLPWIEYLHTGGSKIWYVVPASHTEEFRAVVSELMPRQCRTKKLWLVSDSVMVPPEVLLNHGVPLYRVVQEPGEFLVVFPKAFTSSICTGYVISESVSFARPDWLKSAWSIFNDIRQSKEPPVFPLEQLLLSILTDHKVQPKVLKMALSLAERIFEEEFEYRKKLKGLGLLVKKVQSGEKKKSNSNSGKPKRKDEIEENVDVHECEICNYTLVFSFVLHKAKEIVYCLPHAIELLSKFKGRIKTSVLYYEESETHLRSILEEAKSRLKG